MERFQEQTGQRRRGEAKFIHRGIKPALVNQKAEVFEKIGKRGANLKSQIPWQVNRHWQEFR